MTAASIGGRFAPIGTSPDQIVRRDRLVQRLAQRFDHRLTLVTAPAGSGKSTALSEAMNANRLAPRGTDIWLGSIPADRLPSHFGEGLAMACGAPTRETVDATIDSIVEAVWTLAPEPVSLIIDDAHELAGSESLWILRTLLDRLPTNGSMVLCTRVPLDLGVARMRAHGQLLELHAADLDLTDAEIESFRAARGATVAASVLPRHPASADLQLVAGTSASADFVWEEILSRIDDDRLTHLRRLAVLDVLDDGLIAGLTDNRTPAAELFRGLPLVSSTDDGQHRMHDILRTALVARLEEGERIKALSIAGEVERSRHRLAEAVELFDASGDQISAIDTARELLHSPILTLSSHGAARCRRVVERLDPGGHLTSAFEAVGTLTGDSARAADALRRAADLACEADDLPIESVLRHRAAQALLLLRDPSWAVEWQRISEIGQTLPLAAAIDAYYRSVQAQIDGDGATARAVLDDIDALDLLGPKHALQVRAERLTDLGHPEKVIAGLDREDHAALPDGAKQWIGLAMQQVAIAAPEALLPAGVQLAANAERRGFAQPAAFTHGALTVAAIACGDLRLAERHARLARDHANSGIGPTAEQVVTFAEAALMIARGDEQGAAAHASVLPATTSRSPDRADLWSLPLAYVLIPRRRPVIDAADLGPALSTARQAARALLALRDGDTAPAAALPWHQADLLRTHVPPSWVAEMAITVPDDQAAQDVLDQLHDLPTLLRHASAGSGPGADAATQRLSSLPITQPFEVRLDLLGPAGVRITTPDGTEDSTSLTRRPKATELLALLADRGRLDRYEVIAAIWPDHDDERKALASLRTTLGTANDLLDPGRERGATAFHLRVDGDIIELDERVITDVDDFEAAVTAARTDDEAGLPARALVGYQEALELYRGDFLHGLDAAWAELARLRLRSLATGAMCRVSELVAARGEAETAARWAERALSLDELDERAIRCLIGALDAGGDRSGARRCAETALARLASAGLEPERTTMRLVERL